MYLRNFFIRNRYFSSIQVRKQLKWRYNNQGAQIHIKDSANIISFHVLPNIRFSHFFIAMGIDQRSVTFPQEVNSDSQIIKFLGEMENQKAIEIKRNGESMFLRNKACASTTKDILLNLRDQNGIYQDKQKFQLTNKPQYFNQLSNYLTRYYLKLQAQGYCKINKIDTKSYLTNKIKQDILHYLNKKNQLNCQRQLQTKLKQQALIQKNIQETEEKFKQIQREYQKKENWYKRLVTLITIVHLISFGYMIFFVDWLGWDIIEPLTYTVGVIYTLLGIRFYRKYYVNRSSQTIKQMLFKILMPVEKRNTLKSIQSHLQIQRKQLKKITQEQMILNNRLSFRTSLIQSIRRMI